MFSALRSSPRLRLQAWSVATAIVLSLFLSCFTDLPKRAELKVQDKMVALAATKTDPSLFFVGLDESSSTIQTGAGLEPEEIESSPALKLMANGWPWSREVWALTARRLLDAGARLVIFDFVFPSPRDGDAAFAQAIKDSGGRVIIGFNFDYQTSANQTLFTMPTKALDVPGTAGLVNFPRTVDAVVRLMYPYATVQSFQGGSFGSDKKFPALSTLAAERLGFAPPPTTQPQLLRFRYLQEGSIPTVPLYQLFVPAFWDTNLRHGEVFRDKVVLVGPYSALFQDFHSTPIGRMAGPIIHLNVLSAMRDGRWLTSTTDFLSIPILATIVSAFGVFFLALMRRNVLHFVWGCLVLSAFFTLLFWASFTYFDLFLPVVTPLATILFCGISGLVSDVVIERRERGRMRTTLERYVSKDIVHEIVENPTSYLQTLGGQRKEIVALFCDLKGFTSDSENRDAAEMVALLNEYFSEMVEVIFQRRGTLDKFMGDALMATWGGLGAGATHENSLAALQSSFEMKERLVALNARRAEKGVKAWACGIGICKGPAIFGNIGSPHKMDLTVIGDTVNLTSRIEGLTRIYGCDVLVDERIAADGIHHCRFLLVDIVRVKGRRAHESLFYPYHPDSSDWVERYTAARLKYVAGDFAAAQPLFAALASDGLAPKVAALYASRCATLRQAPPEQWDGVWTFVEK